MCYNPHYFCCGCHDNHHCHSSNYYNNDFSFNDNHSFHNCYDFRNDNYNNYSNYNYYDSSSWQPQFHRLKLHVLGESRRIQLLLELRQ